MVADRQQAVNSGEQLIPLLVADIFECAGRLRRSGDAIASSEGQSQARWQLLSVLSDRSLTVPQAARRLGISRQAVQRVANDLVDEALVEMATNPDHRGSPLLRLTAEGKVVLARITAAASVFHYEIATALAREEIEITRRVLRSLLSQLSSET